MMDWIDVPFKLAVVAALLAQLAVNVIARVWLRAISRAQLRDMDQIAFLQDRIRSLENRFAAVEQQRQRQDAPPWAAGSSEKE